MPQKRLIATTLATLATCSALAATNAAAQPLLGASLGALPGVTSAGQTGLMAGSMNSEQQSPLAMRTEEADEGMPADRGEEEASPLPGLESLGPEDGDAAGSGDDVADGDDTGNGENVADLDGFGDDEDAPGDGDTDNGDNIAGLDELGNDEGAPDDDDVDNGEPRDPSAQRVDGEVTAQQQMQFQDEPSELDNPSAFVRYTIDGDDHQSVRMCTASGEVCRGSFSAGQWQQEDMQWLRLAVNEERVIFLGDGPEDTPGDDDQDPIISDQ